MYIWQKRANSDWLRREGQRLLERVGTRLAVIERPGHKQALLEISCRTEKDAHALLRQWGGKVVKLRPDWLFSNRTRATPIRIGARLVILHSTSRSSARLQSRSRAQFIIIPRETAFGTGEHATTAMCLRLMERVTRSFKPGWRMLDLGTGSGILAIAGSCLGASSVLGVDYDPIACAVTKRNARTNGVRNIAVETGDALTAAPKGRFDLITANLFSEILIKGLPNWSRKLASEGFLIFSGILRGQELPLLSALRKNRLALVDTCRRGKWIALLARLKKQKRS